MRAQHDKTSDRVIHFIKEIGEINECQIEQVNYFSYDDSNMIEATFSVSGIK